MSTLGMLTREAYSKGVPEPSGQETFQYGRLFLRKLPPVPDGRGGHFGVYGIGVSTNENGSNPKGLAVDERLYNLPFEELVRLPPIQASLVSIEREYEPERKLRHQ